MKVSFKEKGKETENRRREGTTSSQTGSTRFCLFSSPRPTPSTVGRPDVPPDRLPLSRRTYRPVGSFRRVPLDTSPVPVFPRRREEVGGSLRGRPEDKTVLDLPNYKTVR